MKIAVIGTGAMGMLFGACLADGGEDVTMVTAGRKETEEAIRLHGIHMLWDEKDIYVKVRTAMAGSLHEQFDLVILFTKAQDSAAVLEKCRDMTGSDTYLMTLQNGLGNVERAGKFVPHEPREPDQRRTLQRRPLLPPQSHRVQHTYAQRTEGGL